MQTTFDFHPDLTRHNLMNNELMMLSLNQTSPSPQWILDIVGGVGFAVYPDFAIN